MTLNVTFRRWIFALVSLVFTAGPAGAQGPPADDGLTQAKAVQAAHEAELFAVPGVLAVGLGRSEEDEWVLHVYATAEADQKALPQYLDGLAVVVLETDAFVPRDSCQPTAGGCPRPTGGCAHRQAFSFPVPSGVSTSNNLACSAGTIAFRVCDAGNPGVLGYISNNHVAAMGTNGCANGAPPGTPQYQPGRCDFSCSLAGNIGTLDRYVTIQPGGNNLVDAAFIRSDAQRVSGNILDIGQPTASPRDPLPGELMKKSGSTTGFTQGTVQSINATVSGIDYGCFSATFVGQIIVTPGSFSAAGDSGSPVVDAGNNPVGLLFAGSSVSTIVNPITRVLDELGVTFDCGPPPSVDDAEFVSQSVPTTLNLNQQFDPSLTFRNVGTTTWRAADGYALGSQNPPNNTIWGFDRFPLPHDVAPQQEVTFTRTATAPGNPAIYPFKWRMVKDGEGLWFGEHSQQVDITVGGGGQCPPAEAPESLSPEGFIDDPTPTFNWTAVPGAAWYKIYVQYEEGDVILGADVFDTEYTPTNPLPVGDDLRWKVKGVCAGGSGPYSTIRRFHVLFADVPATHWARSFIEELYTLPRFVSESLGTDGQGRFLFGPEIGIQRKHMARWLLKARHGAGYVPPPAVGIFSDVPVTSEFAPWAEAFYNQGFTAGCGPSLFCPDTAVTRDQAALLVLRAKEGTAYVPPACVTPTFADVPCSSPYARWVEELHRRGITSGCWPGLYCPSVQATRAQFSVFARETFY